MNDIYLFEKQINMGYEIKKYLSHIFYEMSALCPHDFRTYEHIRALTYNRTVSWSSGPIYVWGGALLKD